MLLAKVSVMVRTVVKATPIIIFQWQSANALGATGAAAAGTK